MSNKRTPGLTKRNGTWHIDKTIYGRRICRSCKTSSFTDAENYLAKITEEIRKIQLYGVRPKVLFDTAAARYVEDRTGKKSLRSDLYRLENLMPWIGRIPIDELHAESLKPWIEHRKREGRAAGTINHGIKLVNQILNLATNDWINSNGQTWLERAPRIALLPDKNKREPYPLRWSEQDELFSHLPNHLVQMGTFAVNTGCRDQEVCRLRWDWEESIPELTTSVFVVPGEYTKNGDDRVIVLNEEAKSIVEDCRGKHPDYVFTFRGKPVTRMMNSAWLRARKKASLEVVRVHDLKHTYGRRLRGANVSFEDRQDLLGHRSNRITTHYSGADLRHLIEASNLVCNRDRNDSELVLLTVGRRNCSRKNHANKEVEKVG